MEFSNLGDNSSSWVYWLRLDGNSLLENVITWQVTLTSVKLTDCQIFISSHRTLKSPIEVGEGWHLTILQLGKSLLPVAKIYQKAQVWLYSVWHFHDDKETPLLSLKSVVSWSTTQESSWVQRITGWASAGLYLHNGSELWRMRQAVDILILCSMGKRRTLMLLQNPADSSDYHKGRPMRFLEWRSLGEGH